MADKANGVHDWLVDLRVRVDQTPRFREVEFSHEEARELADWIAALEAKLEAAERERDEARCLRKGWRDRFIAEHMGPMAGPGYLGDLAEEQAEIAADEIERAAIDAQRQEGNHG